MFVAHLWPGRAWLSAGTAVQPSVASRAALEGHGLGWCSRAVMVVLEHPRAGNLLRFCLQSQMPSCGIDFQGSRRFGNFQETVGTLQGWAGSHQE